MPAARYASKGTCDFCAKLLQCTPSYNPRGSCQFTRACCRVLNYVACSLYRYGGTLQSSCYVVSNIFTDKGLRTHVGAVMIG